MEVTANVLKELNTENIPRILVFNKIDLISTDQLSLLRENFPHGIFISVTKKQGIENLKSRMEKYSRKHFRKYAAMIAKPQAPAW